jgi:hypothetical protein
MKLPQTPQCGSVPSTHIVVVTSPQRVLSALIKKSKSTEWPAYEMEGTISFGGVFMRLSPNQLGSEDEIRDRENKIIGHAHVLEEATAVGLVDWRCIPKAWTDPRVMDLVGTFLRRFDVRYFAQNQKSVRSLTIKLNCFYHSMAP